MNTVTIGNLPLPVVIELIEALRNSGSENKELYDLKNNLIKSVEFARREDTAEKAFPENKGCYDEKSDCMDAKPEPGFKRKYTLDIQEHLTETQARCKYIKKVMQNIDRNLDEMIEAMQTAKGSLL